MTVTALPDFASQLIRWQQQHGRHDLPWQNSHEAYAIWLSEIMLQQTQVVTVMPYYQRFLARFPDVQTLAEADEEAVLALWAGLGYYRRARHLHAAAQRICEVHGGCFPRDNGERLALPGIGRSTAAAIGVFAFGQRLAILDGNVKRVLARVFGIAGWPGEKAVEARLWQQAEALLPTTALRAYTQGLMDLGAMCCTRARPQCAICPFAKTCVACIQGTQASLPGARPGKTLPERETGVLVLLHAGEVLLEKRPGSGIWGGLWSLPEFPSGGEARQVAVGLGYDCVPGETPEALPVLRHVFTHFRLDIHPWCMHVSRPVREPHPGQLWLPLDALPGAALPTPIRKILAAIRV